MFSKNSKSQTNSGSGAVKPVATPPKVSAPGVVPSIVSANLRVTGDLESEGDIQIDGMVEGDVRSSTITVGEHAVVSGSIEADTVHVAGTVKGQINGKMVELARSAKVTGDIVHESLAIQAGAFVQGLCRHVDNVKRTSPGDSKETKETKGPNLVVGGVSDAGEGGAKAAIAAGPGKA